MAYPTSCPTCGTQLTAVSGPPDSAPWLCHPCSAGFWPSELTVAARAVWRSGFRDHGFHHGLRADVKADHAAAHDRGTSTLPEQIPLLDATELTRLTVLLTGVGTPAALVLLALATAAETRPVL